MDLRVNHEEMETFYDQSTNESEFIREKIDFWLKKTEELRKIWKGKEADEYYENVTAYLKRLYVIPEFYNSVNDFILEANKQYKEVDYSAKREFQKIQDTEEYDV
ncbi:MAG: hypothetical protein IKQ33_00930 [Clostridia bacterium]|nr:hypothetical protein [Clostridia bacterium]